MGTKLKLFDPVRLAATFVCVTLLTALLWTVGTDWSVRQTQRYFDELQQTYGSMAEPGAVLNYAQLYGVEEDTAGNSTAASGGDANWGEQPAFYIPREVEMFCQFFALASLLVFCLALAAGLLGALFRRLALGRGFWGKLPLEWHVFRAFACWCAAGTARAILCGPHATARLPMWRTRCSF